PSRPDQYPFSNPGGPGQACAIRTSGDLSSAQAGGIGRMERQSWRARKSPGQYTTLYEYRHIPRLCGELSAQPSRRSPGDDYLGTTASTTVRRTSTGNLLLHQDDRLGRI